MNENTLTFFGLTALTVFCGWAVVSSVKTSNEQIEMIRADLCDIEDRNLYQPPPTYIKSGENTMVPIQQTPYYRVYWVCQDGQTFWRRE
jgi:hypothetical protein